MMAEFVAGIDEPYFYLNIRIYEYYSNRIDFDLEYQDLEDIKRHKEHLASLEKYRINNGFLKVEDYDVVDDEDEEFDDEPADNESVKLLSEMVFHKLKEALQWDNSFDSIKLQYEINECSEFIYYIQIYDNSLSLTTITCDKIGMKIHWGSSTPASLKTAIEKAIGRYSI